LSSGIENFAGKRIATDYTDREQTRLLMLPVRVIRGYSLAWESLQLIWIYGETRHAQFLNRWPNRFRDHSDYRDSSLAALPRIRLAVLRNNIITRSAMWEKLARRF
jgi:hypothetical protein